MLLFCVMYYCKFVFLSIEEYIIIIFINFKNSIDVFCVMVLNIKLGFNVI